LVIGAHSDVPDPRQLHDGARRAGIEGEHSDPRFRPRLADRDHRLCFMEAGYPTTDDEPLPAYQGCYVANPFGNRTELLEPASCYEY
jgi:hypothetical protein